jgi:DNA-binding FadR family transcriptional regulator
VRLCRRIVDRLHPAIDRREYPAGSRQPAERERAGRLGVRRTTVREAPQWAARQRRVQAEQTKMIVEHALGGPVQPALAWASDALEGCMHI